MGRGLGLEREHRHPAAAELTYNLPGYRAIATDPVPLAVGGATLALVLLGLRTLLGSMIGRDHVITHISGRLIPAVFLTLAYPVLIVQGIGLLNAFLADPQSRARRGPRARCRQQPTHRAILAWRGAGAYGGALG